jgi:capsular polysaccharide transport system permease protein
MLLRSAQISKPAQGCTRSFATFRAILALILREMATRYGRSPGGYAWALLEPLGSIIALGFGFSLLVRTPPLGTSFLLFFATGSLPFGMYGNIGSAVGRCINFSRALLFYPAVTWLDAVLARFILGLLTETLVMVIILAGLVIMADSRTLLDIGPIVLSVFLAAVLGLGVGLVNCVLFGLFDIWMQIWGIVMRPLMLISGVLFLYESMPSSIQGILWYNPLMHVTGLMRRGFYSSYQASYVSISYVLMFSMICIFLGIVLMGRFHRDILNR